MASGRINRNGFPDAWSGRVLLAGVSPKGDITYRLRRHRDTESGVTELSGLTSDPICTADRRGGILMTLRT